MTLLHVYRECLANTLKGVRAHPWTLLLPIFYGLALSVAGLVAAPLGAVGGFAMGLWTTALMSSGLYFVGQLVSGRSVRIDEFPQSLGHYFWSVMAVRFVLWIADLLVEPALHTLPNGVALSVVIDLALFILLNATPEVIYQRGTTTGLEPIMASVEFVQRHWIEWFVPNILLGALLYFGFPAVSALLRDAGVPYVASIGMLVVPMIVFPAMLFRGHLFRTLTTYSPHALQMRYRAR